jgi:eukaryotic-like serine/threonine-protein kinase
MTTFPSPEFIALQRAVAGRYSLDRELGRGGMGIVYLARDVSLERPVAIKLLPLSLAAVPGFRERFLREARTAAALAHPHIVPIHAVEQVDDLVFFVMEYVPGDTLGARVRRDGPLSADEGTRILREVAWALGHAHGRGIIHRDIKPDNILLEAGSGRAIVTDLGIAHAEGTAVSGSAGTPHYVAPELLTGGSPVPQPPTAASDLYALGVTAWMTLAGRRPFEQMEGAALVAQQAQHAAPSLAEVLPRLAPRLASAIDRALERDPSARWPDAEAFAAELGATQALRRAIPAPLRRFIVDGRSLGEQVAFGITGAVAAEVGLLALYGWDDFAGVVFHTLAALLGAFAVIRFGEIVAQARELRAQGWGQAAAVAADRADVVEAEAELAPLAAPLRDPRIVFWGGVLKTALAVVVLKFSDEYLVVSLLAAAAMVILPALTAVRLWRIGSKGRPSLWSRIVSGPVGKWIFRGAGIGLPARSAAPVAGEPTALALGQSIEALYAALPAAHQQRLAAVPDLAARLQAHAFGAGVDRTPAVAALETLRLDILRLQAGTISEPELTADLEAVRKLGEEVDRVVAAKAEVARIVS